jgi:pyruvate/2-oxoglutarate dehydrogenase complex dihydrolipoamide acyltransferase (E2) component
MSREKPRFRRDLEAVPVETDGESYVEVRDPKTGARFSFYDFEYRVALAFDGLLLATVIPWVKLSTGMELSEDQLAAFADRLAELGFLEADPSDVEGDPEVSHDDAAVPASAVVPHEVESEVRNAADPSPATVAPEQPAQPGPSVTNAESPSSLRSAAEDAVPVAERETVTYAGPIAETTRDRSDVSRSAAPAERSPVNGPLPSVVPVATPLMPRPHFTPPPAPWATPRPILTPAPTPWGPMPVEQPSARRRLRRSFVLFGSLGVLAAAAVVAMLSPLFMSRQEAPRLHVHVLAVAPTTVFRFFDGTADIRPVPGAVLKFPAAGKVTRIAPAGASLAAGDVVAAVDGAKSLLEKLAGQRERLVFSQQMAEGMRQAGNTTEEERQNGKVESRNAKLAKTLRELAEVAVVASMAGTVDEVLARVDQTVEVGSPAVRLRSTGFRASFGVARPQIAQARKLGFCRLEVDGELLDCSFREPSDDPRVEVELGAAAPSLADKPARLARARFDAAVMVPGAAVIQRGSRDEVLLVSPQSRLESRPVTVAERDATDAVVVQGLDPEDRIVIDGAAALRPGMQVVVP